jgi:hypothetical protein
MCVYLYKVFKWKFINLNKTEKKEGFHVSRSVSAKFISFPWFRKVAELLQTVDDDDDDDNEELASCHNMKE